MKTGQIKIVSPIAPPIPLSPKTATLVRITGGGKLVLDRTYGNFTLPPCPEGERYIAMKIRSYRCITGSKENRREWEVTAEDAAEDLARECNNDIWGIGSEITGEILSGTGDNVEIVSVRGFNGVFVSEFDEPSEEELEVAEGLLAASDELLVSAGNRAFSERHEYKEIHAGFSRAAKRLGVDPEWLFKTLNTSPCPHCGAKLLSKTATVCATCHRDIVPQEASENASERVSKRREKKNARKDQNKVHEAA